MTTVIHVHDAPDNWQRNPDYVYIGRYNLHHGLQRSIWHNPYRIKDLDGLPLNDTEKRASVINKYAAYLEREPQLLARLPELEGKTLVCWCKQHGTDTPCHGDILSKWQTMLVRLSMHALRWHPCHQVAVDTLARWRSPKQEPPGLEYFEGVA